MLTQTSDMETILKSIISSLGKDCYSKCYGPTGHKHETNRISSNVLGQWLKQALLILTNTSAILNQNGHILELKNKALS